MTKIAPARRRGLADEVADRIREAIFSGAYAPGAQLREVELSDALDVSRGPVREALLRLEREGLVRSEWHRGATVTALSPQDVAELDSLRGALEQLAVERVIAHATDDDLAAIEQAAAAHGPRGGRARDGPLRHRVPRRRLRRARHRRLREAWQAIRSQVHLFLLTRIGVSSDGYLAHIPDEHRELVAALRARDADTALELFADTPPPRVRRTHRGHPTLTGG